MKPPVYFSRSITPETVLSLYLQLGIDLPGKVAVKVHSGEVGNQNFIRPEMWKPVIDFVGGTVVECNTAYKGTRHITKLHLETLRNHGWSEHFPVDLLDGEGPDIELEIPDGKKIKKNFVGKNIINYDSMLVLSHFKGHPMGGYGGAIKQLSIGFASSYGKKYIHGVGDTENFWGSDHDSFLRAMADAASSVAEMFKGKLAYINVMANMSVDCDCAGTSAAEPKAHDIGILASTDLMAVDQASLDQVYALPEHEGHDLKDRIESREGLRQISYMKELGMGTGEYTLVDMDK